MERCLGWNPCQRGSQIAPWYQLKAHNASSPVAIPARLFNEAADQLDFNAIVGCQTNASERVKGGFGLGHRHERGDTLVECATSTNFKIMNIQFRKKAERR